MASRYPYVFEHPRETRRRRPDAGRGAPLAWALAAGLLLFLVMMGPSLAGYVYTRDDLGAFHLPVRAFYARCLAAGEPFDWMPDLFCGFYLSGEGQAGMYHPWHLLLYRFLPLAAAFDVELLASFPLMFAGTFVFLRRLLGRADAAMFGGLVFTFCGFNLLHFIHPNAIAVVAHIPWMLWAIDAASDAGASDAGASNTASRRVAWTGITLLTGSQLLLGYPQYVWFSLLAEGAYAVFVVRRRSERVRAIESESGEVVSGNALAPRRVSLWIPAVTHNALTPGPSPVSRERGVVAPYPLGLAFLAYLASAKVVGALIASVQLLPTIDALLHSARRTVEADFANWGSLDPWNLVQWIAPYLFVRRVVGQNTHALSCYLGAVPLVLLVWLFLRRKALGPWRRPAAWAAGCGLLALLLAFGEYGGLYRIQRLLPLVGSFRFPCRTIVLLQFCVAILAAIAFGVLVRHRQHQGKTPWRELRPLAMLTGLSVAVALAGQLLRDRPFFATPAAIWAGPLCIGSASFLLALAARGVRGATAALIVLAAVDSGCYGLSYSVYRHVDQIDSFLARVVAPPAASSGRVLADALRVDQPGLHTGNQMTMLGWQRADGYAGLEPGRRLDYRTLAAMRVAGVEWVKTGVAAAGSEQGLRRHDATWLRVRDPLPRARLVTEARLSADPGAELGHVPLESVALTEQPLNLSGGPVGTAAVISSRPGRLRVRVDSPSTQLLVVAESFHPGWQAWLDGQPQPVLRVNGDFLGCVVSPGQHDLELEFRARSLYYGRILSWVGLGLAFVGLAGFRLRPRRKLDYEDRR